MLVNIFRPTYSGDRPSGQIVNPLKKPASYQSTNLKSSNTQIYKKLPSKGPVGLSIQKLGPPPGSISSNTVLDQRLTQVDQVYLWPATLDNTTVVKLLRNRNF